MWHEGDDLHDHHNDFHDDAHDYHGDSDDHHTQAQVKMIILLIIVIMK